GSCSGHGVLLSEKKSRSGVHALACSVRRSLVGIGSAKDRAILASLSKPMRGATPRQYRPNFHHVKPSPIRRLTKVSQPPVAATKKRPFPPFFRPFSLASLTLKALTATIPNLHRGVEQPGSSSGS